MQVAFAPVVVVVGSFSVVDAVSAFPVKVCEQLVRICNEGLEAMFAQTYSDIRGFNHDVNGLRVAFGTTDCPVFQVIVVFDVDAHNFLPHLGQYSIEMASECPSLSDGFLVFGFLPMTTLSRLDFHKGSPSLQ